MIYFLLSFLLGFIIKKIDNDIDEKNKKIPFIFILIYGLFLGILLNNPIFFNLGLGLIIAQIISKKIDSKAHVLGVLLGFIVLFLLKIPKINPLIVLGFIIFGTIDEILDDKKLPRITSNIFSLILGFSINWEYFIFLTLFDLGYTIASFMD